MASTTTFGDFPGVKVETTGGAITQVVVGRTQKVVLFGEGDLANASASVNTPTQIKSRRDADVQFGDGSELAVAMKDALANGANIDYLYGVMVDETSVTNESFSASSSGTLANVPIVEDLSTVTVTDTVASVSASVEFKYESPPNTPSNADTVFINPLTGEWTADASSDYDFDYDYQTWDAAIDSAGSVFTENDTGIYVALSDSEDVNAYMSGAVNTQRSQYKMIRGVGAAQPNVTDADDGSPKFDTVNYTDNLDNDAYFLHAPSRKKDSQYVMSGAVGGLFGGNALDDAVYNDSLTGVDPEQDFTGAQAQDMRNANVIPIRDIDSVKLKGNDSTSTKTDWKRDFWRRRIVDQTILIAKQVGESIVGRINNPETRGTAEELISVELRALARSGLIKRNTTEEENWYVEVYEDGTDQVGIDLGITPFGIVERVDVSVTVNA